jgi:poly(A) polymerase
MSEVPTGSVRPACRREDALAVLRALRGAGHVAYFAGGCVRDLLLGLAPKDWDVATDAPPPRVRKIFPRTQAVGAAFGVILVRQGQSIVEVATFRADGPYEDGRRPTDVRFTTAEEDARRRDFTINGLFLDPLEGSGKLIDYVGGRQDIKDRVLRAIGEPARRFEEDHLRMLRAVRFAARFELSVDPKTADAIVTHAPQLKRISPERIAEELRLMLTQPTRDKAWKLLWDSRLLVEIFRFLSDAKQVPLDESRSVFLHCAAGETIPFGLALAAGALCFRRHCSPDVDVAALARDGAVAKARAMRQALHLSNEEHDQMRAILRDAGWLILERNPTVAAIKRLIASANFKHARRLLDALSACGFHVEKIQQLRGAIDEAARTAVAPPPLVTGEDLIALGLQPGRLFRVVLDQVYDAQLEGKIASKEQALDFVRRLTS